MRADNGSYGLIPEFRVRTICRYMLANERDVVGTVRVHENNRIFFVRSVAVYVLGKRFERAEPTFEFFDVFERAVYGADDRFNLKQRAERGFYRRNAPASFEVNKVSSTVK